MKEIVTGDFISACCDYFWLQEKEYPQRLVYKIICDRYKLNTIQRVIVYRGIFPSREAVERKSRCLTELHDVNLSVDVTNVIFKLSNYLCGRPVFISNDNLLRDAGDAFDKDYSADILFRSVSMLIEFFISKSLISLHLLLDKPVDGTALIHEELDKSLPLFHFPTQIREVYPADHFLEGPQPNVIATADSEVIDKFPFPFFDIPRCILDKHFQPDYLDIDDLLRSGLKDRLYQYPPV
jgi:hypothetical protein